MENKGEFKLGRAQVITEGNDLSIIACGIMVEKALVAAKNLLEKKIKARVINIHTIKPIDKEVVLKAAKETHGIIVCEEHQVVGGLASAIDEIVAENSPVKVMRIGIKSRYGQSGEPDELLREYQLEAEDIEKASLSILK